MSVVLRQQETGHYFQCSGKWNPNRETAKEFLSALVAYWWAVDKRLLGTEVWLALADPRKDLVCMKVQSASNRAVINCEHLGWREELHSLLFNGIEVGLINFDYALHGESCQLLAEAFVAEFSLDRVPETRLLISAKSPGWHPPRVHD